MKVTTIDVMNSIESLKVINALELPFKLSYKIAKHIKELDPILTAYQETHKKLIEKFCNKDEEGNVLTKKVKDPNDQEVEVYDLDETNEEYQKEYSDLLNVENEVNIEQISINEFEDVDVKPNDVMSIMWMLKED